MTSKVRVLALALIAILSIGAIGASAASAMKFTSTKYPATVTGSQTSSAVFEFGTLKVTCSVTKLNGELTAASEVLSLAPSYEGCTSGGTAAEVKPNGCTYRMHAPPTGSEEGSTDILCPEGKSLEVNALTCTIKYSAPQTLKHVFIQNTEGPTSDLDIHVTLTSVEATVTKDNILCPLESSTIATGKYTEDNTLQSASSLDVG